MAIRREGAGTGRAVVVALGGRDSVPADLAPDDERERAVASGMCGTGSGRKCCARRLSRRSGAWRPGAGWRRGRALGLVCDGHERVGAGAARVDALDAEGPLAIVADVALP